jgi:hypothetical protein
MGNSDGNSGVESDLKPEARGLKSFFRSLVGQRPTGGRTRAASSAREWTPSLRNSAAS